jgi:predicted lysophospholipase L1 biosynthesis ABC-type transport system permease subunit
MTETSAPRSRGKLPARYASIVMPLVLSIIMTFVVSAIATLKSLGPTPAFLDTWPSAWALSWLVAFPTLLAVLPLVRRIVGLVVETPPPPR